MNNFKMQLEEVIEEIKTSSMDFVSHPSHFLKKELDNLLSKLAKRENPFNIFYKKKYVLFESKWDTTFDNFFNMLLVIYAQKNFTKLDLALNHLKGIILSKNRKYGNAALNPMGVFVNSDVGDSIKIRMEDKLRRIQNEQTDENEDARLDLLGYYILFKIAQKPQ